MNLGRKMWANNACKLTICMPCVFRRGSWLEVDSVKIALFRPTHPRVMLTVSSLARKFHYEKRD